MHDDAQPTSPIARVHALDCLVRVPVAAAAAAYDAMTAYLAVPRSPDDVERVTAAIAAFDTVPGLLVGMRHGVAVADLETIAATRPDSSIVVLGGHLETALACMHDVLRIVPDDRALTRAAATLTRCRYVALAVVWAAMTGGQHIGTD